MKHFNPNEFVCDNEICYDKMNQNLLNMLEEAREIADIPFIITSSWRSEEKNKEVNGKSNSSHLRGNAVDLSCNNSVSRMKIIDALVVAGFTRIGISKSFIHVDCDIELPQEVMWLY